MKAAVSYKVRVLATIKAIFAGGFIQPVQFFKPGIFWLNRSLASTILYSLPFLAQIFKFNSPHR
ncbi:hypothetical protein [Foetidibacter luteolus]|uniref:hypothetical protein n=1 Tax=Foetidibacter luteolus TaxID=2608880 RepID=UPI00129A7243|nr:hypothetical protein [Foetidibacter luteolus]